MPGSKIIKFPEPRGNPRYFKSKIWKELVGQSGRPSKEEIARSFAQGAKNYDHYATIQRLVSRTLAKKVSDAVNARNKTILDIGCGTGFLGESFLEILQEDISSIKFYLSDLSREMLEICQEKYEAIIPNSLFLAMDGELPCLRKNFDIVLSSLAFQWFNNLEKSFSEILNPANCPKLFSFSILGPETMKEWREFAERNNFQVGLLELLNKDQLLNLIKKSNISKKKYICRFERQLISKTYPDLYSFLREMKMIGANSPNISYEPHDPGKLRRLLRLAKDEYKNGFISTFEIYYFLILFD